MADFDDIEGLDVSRFDNEFIAMECVRNTI